MAAVPACQTGFVWKAEPYLQSRKHCYGHSFESQKRASIELMGSLYEPVQKPPAGSVMDF